MKLIAWVLFLCALLYVTIIFAWIGSFGWSEALLDNRTFNVSLGLINWANLIYWMFYLLLFFALGLLIATISNSRTSIGWALAFGCAYSLILFYRSHEHFSQYATPVDYFWEYGKYLMPIFGAASGASIRRIIPSIRTSIR